jgi:mannose-6-phosphate isomerase-like protein (cupin superfamily)
MQTKLVILAIAACALPAAAQTLTVNHVTQSQIIQKANDLEPKAQGPDRAASTKLEEYPNHYTMVALRHKDGGGEIHENFADFFFVVQGSATLLTGGTLENPKTEKPGEIRGSSLQNGTSTSLSQGDFVHIPAGLPHQLLIPQGSTFIYYVIKVKEK